MENIEGLFGEKDLKQVLYGAVILSSFDGKVHEKEWERIQTFADRHWQSRYGDFLSFQKNLLYDVNQLLGDVSELFIRADSLVEELSVNLKPRQKTVLVELLSEVMPPCGVFGNEDADVLSNILDRLSPEAEEGMNQTV